MGRSATLRLEARDAPLQSVSGNPMGLATITYAGAAYGDHSSKTIKL